MRKGVILEIEAKFTIPDEDTFQFLLDTTSLAGFSLGTLLVIELHDRYLDTRTGAIRSAGYACRIRRQNGHHVATLKGLGRAAGGVHRREELEVTLSRPSPPQDWPSSPARDLALRHGGNEPLIALFDLEQIRHSRPLYESDRLLVELNLDRVTVCQGGKILATFLELEAELLPQGSEQDLQRLVSHLEEEWNLAPQERSKFERVMALLDREETSIWEAKSDMEVHPLPEQGPIVEIVSQEHPSPPVELLDTPGIEPNDPMSEAGRKTFRFHYRRMVYNEPGTRLGEDIEALHDMRVATRRMRAAFRVFEGYFKPKAVAPYLKGLKRTGRALGPVRDLDVFREKIGAYLDTLPESQRGSLDSFLVVLEARREAARQRMIAYLDSEKYDRFREGFGEFVETEGLGSRPMTFDGGEPRPHRVCHVAPVTIYQRLAAVRAYDEWVTIPDLPWERLHALRIACKRLRYTMEFFREVLGPDSSMAIKEVVSMQDHLGAVQDAVVASGILRDFLTWGTWGHDADEPSLKAGTTAGDPGVEAYLAAKQAEMQHLLATFPEAWQHLNRPEFSGMVADAIAVL